ncbi:hypothetical protein [Natronobiforma cellulositropha]|uniref:hypothetical protein n=1 Tax=Natronobiforma cellulositropha TaxID=1679076 RepID=UPI0021D57558|nr:hypothetical protein [Natronobiforma cellulositropha]
MPTKFQQFVVLVLVAALFVFVAVDVVFEEITLTWLQIALLTIAVGVVLLLFGILGEISQISVGAEGTTIVFEKRQLVTADEAVVTLEESADGTPPAQTRSPQTRSAQPAAESVSLSVSTLETYLPHLADRVEADPQEAFDRLLRDVALEVATYLGEPRDHASNTRLLLSLESLGAEYADFTDAYRQVTEVCSVAAYGDTTVEERLEAAAITLQFLQHVRQQTRRHDT